MSMEKDEINVFINGSTVNETYFFREEAQFSLLKDKIFPAFRTSLSGAPLRIWSAAASSGEEIYSLYLLASSLGINAECVATDINTLVLEKCAKGEYSSNSLRTLDGAKFHYLLAPYQNVQKEIKFPPEITGKIERKKINLSKLDEPFPRAASVVFLRNVFIYFSLEMRKAILEKIAGDCLLPGGCLFVSMSETALLDKAIMPKNLEKISDGKVFYFKKVL